MFIIEVTYFCAEYFVNVSWVDFTKFENKFAYIISDWENEINFPHNHIVVSQIDAEEILRPY